MSFRVKYPEKNVGETYKEICYADVFYNIMLTLIRNSISPQSVLFKCLISRQ